MVDTARTETDLLENLFQDGQAPGSITPQDVRDLIVSVKYMNGGWEFALDSAYTAGSPLSITGLTRTKITIDGLLESSGNPSTGALWNTTSNKITPPAINDFIIVRFAIQGQSTSAATNKFEVELDVGGTAGVIFRETEVFSKGAGNPQNFNAIMPLFVGSDFLSNGGELYITPDEDATFWEFGITISKVHSALP